mgnify:CR=1 FL=1
MTQHYTSYETSKQLQEVGIKLGHDNVYCINEPVWKGPIPILQADSSEIICPAYTAGELLRGLRFFRRWINFIFHDDGNCSLRIDTDKDIYKPELMLSGYTPEDALALALIEIKKGNNNAN